MRYRFDPLRVPNEAVRVATYDATDKLLSPGGAVVPQTIVIEPDNSEGVASVVLDEDAPTGTRYVVADIHGATANNITVTAVGSFVSAAGAAVDQVVIDADDGFAVLDIINGLTVVSASKGVDLET